MRYIVIKGAKYSGKSKTISEVCNRLNPESIRKVFFSETGYVTMENVSPSYNRLEGTFIVTVRSKNILVVSHAPTEQKRNITFIIKSIQTLGIIFDFGIIAVRGLEKLKDFSTYNELENFGKCVYETKLWRIPSYNYYLTEEWNKRISYLTAITLHNI